MDEELAAFKNKLTNGKLSKLAVVSIQRSLSPAVIFIFFYFVLSIQYFNYHTIVSGLYATQAVDLDAYRLRYLASFVVFDRRIANIHAKGVMIYHLRWMICKAEP